MGVCVLSLGYRSCDMKLPSRAKIKNKQSYKLLHLYAFRAWTGTTLPFFNPFDSQEVNKQVKGYYTPNVYVCHSRGQCCYRAYSQAVRKQVKFMITKMCMNTNFSKTSNKIWAVSMLKFSNLCLYCTFHFCFEHTRDR
jgi:hypothetical protein